ncbi:TPA: hypothetical protein ACGW3M_001045 [Pseudomonas aeruginosa]|uniref:hypothetical protein n=1 Tax=Pseudomonas aeruginosa TaxID=287 RepID=UPI0027FE25DD|nr:hypothetical protein [Pseudomonas aeruginosa]ELJ2276139.1 hypothetical protein [Pseudomonas aeruginosa]
MTKARVYFEIRTLSYAGFVAFLAWSFPHMLGAASDTAMYVGGFAFMLTAFSFDFETDQKARKQNPERIGLLEVLLIAATGIVLALVVCLLIGDVLIPAVGSLKK